MPEVTTATMGIYVVSDCKTETGTLTTTGDIVNVIAEPFDRASVQITNTASGSTFVFEVSNDSSNWVSVAGYAPSAPATETVTSTTSTGMTVFRLDAKYFRVRISAFGSGTASATVHLRALYTAD